MDAINANKKALSIIKFSFWLNVVLAVCIVVLCGLLIFLFPLKENTPFLVRFSGLEKSYVTIEKADAKLRGNQALIKYLLDAYVVNRETIDRATHNERREAVMLYTAKNEQQRYTEFLISNRATIETESFFRNIEVLSIVLVSKSVAIVEFAIKDMYENELQKIVKFKATVKFTFKPIKIKRQNSYKNPIGLLVEEYQLSEIKEPKKEEQQ